MNPFLYCMQILQKAFILDLFFFPGQATYWLSSCSFWTLEASRCCAMINTSCGSSVQLAATGSRAAGLVAPSWFYSPLQASVPCGIGAAGGVGWGSSGCSRIRCSQTVGACANPGSGLCQGGLLRLWTEPKNVL